MMDWWWAYLALGAFVGFFGGLLGIGGGSAMVPVLVLIFTAKGFPADLVVHLALGTGIATIIFTSAVSIGSHHSHGAVNWLVWRRMLPGVAAGTLGGALLAGALDARLLAIAFTLLIYAMATQMLFEFRPVPAGNRQDAGVMAAAGGIIGLIASWTATAGATLTVPFLVKRNIGIHHAIGTAAAVGWPLAAAGTLGYAAAGWGRTDLPEWSAGFVYLPATAWISAASMATAPLGARVAHRTPGRTLKRVFALVLFLLATNMLISTLR
jgi:uncharacterized membrane protein YfcA